MCALEFPPSKIANALWLVPTTEVHQAFLRRVFIESRKALWQGSALDATWIDQLLEDQYSLHQLSYGADAKDCYSYIIAAKGQWVGRLLVRADNRELHLIDITLLPDHQNQGIGSHVLRYLQQQVSARGQLLTLNTDVTNRAYQWYLRCGFTITQQSGIDYAMVWNGQPRLEPNSVSIAQ